MPRYEVTSSLQGANGNAPRRKMVWTRKPEDAARKAYPYGGGRLEYVQPIEYDHVEGRFDFVGTTTKGTSFHIVVREVRWFEFWKFFL